MRILSSMRTTSLGRHFFAIQRLAMIVSAATLRWIRTILPVHGIALGESIRIIRTMPLIRSHRPSQPIPMNRLILLSASILTNPSFRSTPPTLALSRIRVIPSILPIALDRLISGKREIESIRSTMASTPDPVRLVSGSVARGR